MTIKDILKDAIIFVEKNELLGLSTFDESSQIAPTTEQQSDIDMLVRCFNYIYKEIASNYIYLLKKENINFVDNKYDYSNLSENLIKIISLKQNSRNVKFVEFPTYLEANTKTAEIVYAYRPDSLTITDDFNLFGGKILPQVIAYGIAREWNLLAGNFPEADIWEQRFKDGIFVAHSAKATKRLPVRSFR